MRLDGPGWGPRRFEVMTEPKPTRWIVWDNEAGVPASCSVATYNEAEKLRKKIVATQRAGKRRVRRRG
jgi:hypothetical protein